VEHAPAAELNPSDTFNVQRSIFHVVQLDLTGERFLYIYTVYDYDDDDDDDNKLTTISI